MKKLLKKWFAWNTLNGNFFFSSTCLYPSMAIWVWPVWSESKLFLKHFGGELPWVWFNGKMEEIFRFDIYNSDDSVFWRQRGSLWKLEHMSAVFVVKGGLESALAVCTPWVSLTANGPYINIGPIVDIHDPAQVWFACGGQIQSLDIHSISMCFSLWGLDWVETWWLYWPVASQ